MAAEEQDACSVCEGDRSTTRNPIIFCDGKGCNMPVHKLCYNVREIPEDDWYCQRCENKRRKKATNIICCPMQTGAVKKTTVAGEYMHVVCAMWNKEIDNESDPYVVSKSLIDKDTCHYCSQKKGICMSCEESNCTIHFHATCGINNSLITPASSVPSNFVSKCSKHQTIHYPKKVSKGKRRLRRNDSDDEEESEEESEDDTEESEEEEVEDEEDDDDDDDDDESEEERRQKEKKKRSLLGTSNSNGMSANKSKPPGTVAPITPMKRRVSPQSLFPEDQQSSDDDDDMGTSSTKSKSNTFNNSKTSTNTVAPLSSAASTPSYKERLEAKRKKSALDSRPAITEDKKPLSITPPPAISSVTPKQKLPNKSHLINNNNNNNAVGPRPTGTPPLLNNRYNNVAGGIKNIDEIQNDIKNQRWNNIGSSGTQLQHPQPTTPNAIPTTSFFESELARNNNTGQQRKSMDGWKALNGEKEELTRLREENRRLTDFKRAVSEVFSALNVQVPPGISSDSEHIENYVSQLQLLLRRVGPIRDQERVQIQECVKNLANSNT